MPAFDPPTTGPPPHSTTASGNGAAAQRAQLELAKEEEQVGFPVRSGKRRRDDGDGETDEDAGDETRQTNKTAKRAADAGEAATANKKPRLG